ncbi:unnamed protein product [Mycena citricolor]|uniref:[histone H3]-trimethyl-L-lysine(4) demethylase n=1 Tax=Mycena citricolor TaxID=2018698 RepID=A0AAD2HFT2_9AGAR|nr:unnamed protein product [Mycena citricolor]
MSSPPGDEDAPVFVASSSPISIRGGSPVRRRTTSVSHSESDVARSRHSPTISRSVDPNDPLARERQRTMDVDMAMQLSRARRETLPDTTSDSTFPALSPQEQREIDMARGELEERSRVLDAELGNVAEPVSFLQSRLMSAHDPAMIVHESQHLRAMQSTSFGLPTYQANVSQSEFDFGPMDEFARAEKVVLDQTKPKFSLNALRARTIAPDEEDMALPQEGGEPSAPPRRKLSESNPRPRHPRKTGGRKMAMFEGNSNGDLPPFTFDGGAHSTSGILNTGHDRPYRFSFYSNAMSATIHARSLSELPAEGQSFGDLFSGNLPAPGGMARDQTRPGPSPLINEKAPERSNGKAPVGDHPRRSGNDPETNTWWLDIQSPTDDEMKMLSKVFGIHPLTTEDIQMEETREKIELFRNYYLVCFRSFDQDQYSPTHLEPLNMYIIVFREGTLSFHFRPTPHPQNVRRRIKQLKDYISVTSDWISYALIDDITDAFGPLIQGIEYEVDSIDELVLILKEAEQSDMLRRIGTCRKKVMGLLRLMGNKADVVKGLAKRCNEHWRVAPTSDIGLYLSDIQDHLITMTQNLNHYEKILSRSHSNYLAQISIEMTDANNQINDVLSKLTALGTVLIPMNLVTGLWAAAAATIYPGAQKNPLTPGTDFLIMSADSRPSATPRGTPSRRGKSPATPSLDSKPPNWPSPHNIPQDSPSSATPRGSPSRRGKSPRVAPASSASHLAPPSDKSTSAFYSCIRIPVEGAVPINPPDKEETLSAQTEPVSGRAPRKSKTDALQAIKTGHSAGAGETDEDEGEDERNDVWAERYRNVPPIVPPKILDLSTVKTESLRPDSLPRKEARPFGLPDCPTFYPTVEEFRDPMAYIRSISETANAHGICKVVPPAGWKMPFVTDTANFRFKTRVQRLNSVEASSRAKLNFLEQLYVWHQQQGNPRVSVPTINNKPLDLYLLRKEVRKLGGFYVVSKNKLWSELGRILGYSGIPGLSTQLKNSYTRVILPFEEYEAKNASKEASKAPLSVSKAPQPIPSKAPAVEEKQLTSVPLKPMDISPPESPLTATSSPLSEPPEDGERATEKTAAATAAAGRPRRSTRMGSKTPGLGRLQVSPLPVPTFHDGKDLKGSLEQNCEICHKKNRGFHMFCLDPPLDAIPKEQWFCYTCLAGTGGDYGFDEGDEHSLSSFHARDNEFRRVWFESHPPMRDPDALEIDDPTSSRIGNVTVSEYDLEMEFWRLVDTQEETVEVEYGADVHSTTHGSAMPTMETHPLNSYATDPWNLNNIPIVSDSLLQYIKSDISGMTVPWTYVGMTFSTFCWHNEDHYTYSINFMHWGETKTWYGIPGEDAELFEAAIKSEAPDLFQAQPDLLFQLVTLMNPKRVTDAGVKVYACNQRAGEFVITCPKSYHAGFNHGFNFNEAVNFALPDWLKYGKECVQRYQDHRKLPVFSHDELLITIFQQSQSIKTAIWLYDSLAEMTEREINDRQTARGLGMTEILEEEDRPEDQYQCTTCKVFCYLSQITCGCKSAAIACIQHTHLVCERPGEKSPEHLILRKRFPDEYLKDALAAVAQRAAIPETWRAKLSKVLQESRRPSLRSLRALASEGERINYHLPELVSLRRCVQRANQWVESANSFLMRKTRARGGRRSRGRYSTGIDAEIDWPEKRLEELRALLRDVETLGFDSSEIAGLQALGETAEKTRQEASALLLKTVPEDDGQRDEYIESCKRIVTDGASLNVLLDEVVQLDGLVKRERLIAVLENSLDDDIGMDECRDLLERAAQCGVPMDHPQVQQLQARMEAGCSWEDRARALLEKPIKTIAELTEASRLDDTVSTSNKVYREIMALLNKAKDFERQAFAWLTPTESDHVRPKGQEVIRLATRAEREFKIEIIDNLRQTAVFALDLESQCEAALHNKAIVAKDMTSFALILKWREYAHAHLHMFTLPWFSQLDAQLEAHFAWVKTLPWYCPEHEKLEWKSLVEDVIECTRPEEDLPPTAEWFTCICTEPVKPPPAGQSSDAVQCDHCYARFHGACANNGGSCPFCDYHHWNGSIHKDRSWHFAHLGPMLLSAPELTKNYSDEWKQLEMVVHRVDRLAGVIGQFLAYTKDHEPRQPDHLPQVRHFMRKLYKLQFAVAPAADTSFGLELAGLHRILALRKGPVNERHAAKLAARKREKELMQARKKRRVKFTFGQDVDVNWKDGTRCICRGRTPYLLNYPPVTCDMCNRKYHAGCVFFPDDSKDGARFHCPVCMTKKNLVYPYAEVRIRPPAELRQPTDQYVDAPKMIEQSTKELIFKTLGMPYTKTLFLEVVKVDVHVSSSASSSSASASHARSVFRPQPYRHPHARAESSAPATPPLAIAPPPSASSSASMGNYFPPPPPPPPIRSPGDAVAALDRKRKLMEHQHQQPHVARPAPARTLEELHAFEEPVTIYPKREQPGSKPLSPSLAKIVLR